MTVARVLALTALRFCASDRVTRRRSSNRSVIRQADRLIPELALIPEPDLTYCQRNSFSASTNDTAPQRRGWRSRGDIGERSAFVDHAAQRVDERGQRQRLDERLHRVRESCSTRKTRPTAPTSAASPRSCRPDTASIVRARLLTSSAMPAERQRADRAR